MTDLFALADKVERLDGPDREVDAEIWLATTPGATRNLLRYEHKATGTWQEIDETRDASRRLIIVPSFTASMDAAASLKDPADEWELTTLYGVARVTVGLNRDHQTSWPGSGEHLGGDAVLAFTAAALRALASQEVDRG